MSDNPKANKVLVTLRVTVNASDNSMATTARTEMGLMDLITVDREAAQALGGLVPALVDASIRRYVEKLAADTDTKIAEGEDGW